MKTNCRWPYHITDMRRVNHRNNNLFDDCSVWWLQQVRPTPPSSSPTCSQTILPPTATPRFEFNKWPNHSTRDYVASKNWNFPSGADSHWPFNAPCPVIFLFIERFCHPPPEIPLFLSFSFGCRADIDAQWWCTRNCIGLMIWLENGIPSFPSSPRTKASPTLFALLIYK